MSPVSPVFHTVVTVSIGLKICSEWEHPFCIFLLHNPTNNTNKNKTTTPIHHQQQHLTLLPRKQSDQYITLIVIKVDTAARSST